ncbi:hypothetical protein D3C84_1039470 [compost metagenome]
MVEEDALAELGGRVDLDAGHPAREMRDEAAEPAQPVVPAPVRQSVQHHGMQAGVQGEHMPGRAGGRVALEDAADIGAQALEHR